MGDIEVRIKLRNAGMRPGKEVIQVYLVLRPHTATGALPSSLCGFKKIPLLPGESRIATVQVPARAFTREAAAWQSLDPPYEFEIRVGPSSMETKLQKTIRVE